ncbi:MAG: ADP-L-glycero-D-mannoheptose-6-epimerase [Methanosaeta sp. PtaU1.Bin028]|nr:MAG: ADP-L-glycero-D-mannoheptose-6-epimerase [Methanosaeta sp. PtaU1.Bin028]
MKILVTGGAGFIGSNLAEDLLSRGEEVTVLDNMHTGTIQNLTGLQGPLEVIEASCNSLPSMDLHPDRIYHLGIPSSSPMYKKDPYLVGQAINGFVAVLELARKCNARLVYASSSSLYSGLQPPHREDMPIKVTDFYTEARLAMERLAELYKRLFDVNSVGLRFFSVYGPKERAKEKYANMITQFLWDIVANRSPVIYGDGTQTRDFIYVKDVVSAMTKAMNSEYNGILNVGTGEAHSFNQAVDLISQRFGLEVKPSYVDNPIKNYVQHTLSDNSMAESAIGFKAQYTLEMGIDSMAAHYFKP